ncbi:MAG: ABC transporter permease subunit [Thermoplasmata archaeon]
MVTGQLIKERFRLYWRGFANAWSLFKQSKIGVAGIAIMIAFVILGVMAPFIGLRDPIHWRAPSEDVIELETFWVTDTSTFLFEAGDPIDSPVAFRVTPRHADPQADRVFAASGDKLLGIDPATGLRGWRTPFQASSEITAGPVVVNYGDKIREFERDDVVYIGTSDGTFYALNDTKQGGETGSPGGRDVISIQLSGAITSIAVYSDKSAGRDPEERVFVSTTEGRLYAFSASGTNPLWNRTFGQETEIVMAAGPMNPPTNPSYSPAITEDGTRIFLNAGDWYGLYTENGTFAWSQPFAVSTPWNSAPIVAIPSILGGSFGELVYAASDDGWLFARHAISGLPYENWETSPIAQLHPSGVQAIPVMETSAQRDEGPLHAPFIDSLTIYIASESGYFYSITRDAVGATSAGAIKWQMSEKLLRERGFGFVASPVVFTVQRLIYTIGLDPGATEGPTDDLGVLHAWAEDGTLVWRREFAGSLNAYPAIWTAVGEQLAPSLWIGTSEGIVYSLSTTGRFLAPLSPGTYPSGNLYLWGTDDQGRDILSQFIWGSRIALVVGFASALLAVGIGTIVGLIAAYVGKKTEIVLMRFTDVFLVLPVLPLLIIMSAVLGAGIVNVILVIGLLAWPGTARVIRSQVLSLKERPYIESARVTGASHIRIMFRHIAPNVVPLVFLYMTFAVSGAILFEAALSFLGLGDINTPSWGTMLSTIQQSDLIRAYWWLLPPGLGITFLSLAFYFTGRAVEEIINPRLRAR